MNSEVEIGEGSLRIARLFDAPRPEVFSWWAHAEKLQQWSGCKQAVRCDVVMDFRVGGSFRQKMRIAVAGRECDFVLTGVYDEIVVPERISYRADLGAVITTVLVEFLEQGRRTKVILTQNGFANPGACKTVANGTVESLDHLGLILHDERDLTRE